MERKTNYWTAVHFCNNNIVICNDIPNIDSTVFDNMRFERFDENGNEVDIFQWFITDCSLSDVEFLEKSFGLLFTESNLLGCFILCVDHCGTPWKGVRCSCFNDNIPDGLLHCDGEF